MKITPAQLRRIIREEVESAITESPIFAASAMVGMKGAGEKSPKTVMLKTATGDHEVLNVDQKTGKMRVRKKGSSAAPFDVDQKDVKQIVEARKVRSVSGLLEGHARITEEEMAAWKSGDWGFTSKSPSGHDHQEFLHGHESGSPMDDEGDMVKSRMASMKKMAAEICDMLDADDQLPAWAQDLLATSHNDLRHVHDYLVGGRSLSHSQVSEARLVEVHNRITSKEIAAWKRGDWGFVSEGLEGAKEMTGAEAEAFIASKDPNETVEQDVIDSETGEIYVEKGRTYGSSYLHPERHARKKAPASMGDLDDDDEIMSDIGRSKDVHAELTSALEEFASGWEGFSADMSDVDPQSAAADAALSFFHMYPQWKDWAGSLGMSKADIQRAAADYAHDAMTK